MTFFKVSTLSVKKKKKSESLNKKFKRRVTIKKLKIEIAEYMYRRIINIRNSIRNYKNINYYTNYYKNLKYDKSDIVNLSTSFLILHELTAVIPLLGLYVTLDRLNVTDSIYHKFDSYVNDGSSNDSKIKEYVKEGEEKWLKLTKKYLDCFDLHKFPTFILSYTLIKV